MQTFTHLTDSPWVMMTLGLVAHLLFKMMRVKDTTKRNETKMDVGLFVREYVAPFIFSLIASFVFTAISIDKQWPVWSAFFMSMASSSALYNIYPVVTNPNLWRGIAGIVTNKVAPPKDDSQP